MPQIISACTPVQNLQTTRYSLDIPDEQLPRMLRILYSRLRVDRSSIELAELNSCFNVSFSHRSDVDVLDELKKYGLEVKVLGQ
jgi:hypothetical protein